MKTVAIIQARYRSTRLQGKVLLDLGGTSVLGNVIRRLQKCQHLDGIVVATRSEPESHLIINEAIRYGANYFSHSGSVLERYYRCAKFYSIDKIVRITADCPYIMPDVVDSIIDNSPLASYANNVFARSFPKGLDCEVFGFETLDRAYKAASTIEESEHVTTWMFNNSSKVTISDKDNYSHKRLTLDTPEDYKDLQSYYPIIGNVYDYPTCKTLMHKLVSTEESSINIELGRV